MAFSSPFDLGETTVRASVFIAVFLLFVVLETVFPRRQRSASRWQRWRTNGAMLLIGTGVTRLVAIGAPFLLGAAAAGLVGSLGIGLFNQVNLPAWLEIGLAIILLDLAIWFQHVLSHKVPVLWRIHRVHHADRDLDASSALRFHPAEILLSAAYKVAIIALLGPAVLAIVLFEIILNASALFNHANLAIPSWLDRALRTLVVTPDMHRIHHSVRRDEHDTNFGFCLSVWDRLFGTWTRDPRGGQTGMTLGLAPHQSGDSDLLGWSLRFPVLAAPSAAKGSE